MSESTAASAAPVVNTPANSAETPNTSTESRELDSQEAELDAAEGEEVKESEEKEEKEPKKSKKEEKALEKRLKKLKLKVDGKEFEQEIDLDDEESLVRELQMAKLGQKRAQEKAEQDKQLKSFFDALQKDPISVLSKEMGLDPNKFIEDYINQQLENAKKSPEQLEREKLEQELQRMKQEREQEKQTLQQKELERLQQIEFERYDSLMEKALTKNEIPKTPYYVKKIADYMLVALESGMDVTPDDVIPLVKEEMKTDLSEIFGSMSEDDIEGLLGEQVLNKLRKRRVAKAQAAQKALPAGKVVDAGKTSKDSENKPKEKVSYRDFFKV